MTANVRQFGGSQARVFFNRPQGVGCLDGLVLARVTGENDSTVVPFHERQQLQHVFAADLSGFIHEDDGVTRHGSACEKGADRFRAVEPVSFQVHHLLTLRREDLNWAALSIERRMNFPKGVRFAGTSPTPEQGHEIPRRQDLIDGLALL